MIDDLDSDFDDHPSLDASLEDFEHDTNGTSPIFGLPSQHSGFRDDDGDDDDSEDNDSDEGVRERWSPPGFRPYGYARGNSWDHRQSYKRGDISDRHRSPGLKSSALNSPFHSREPSPQVEGAVEDPIKKENATISQTVGKHQQASRSSSLAETNRVGGSVNQLSNCMFFFFLALSQLSQDILI